MMDRAIASMAFNPPPCTYSDKNVKKIRTVDGDWICMRLIAPFSVIHPHDTCTIDSYCGEQRCILYSHGNAEDLHMIEAELARLADELDVNFITWDPVGFGRSSEGTPTEKNMQTGIEAVYDYATVTLRIPQSSITLMGRSIGTAPTIYLASRAYCQCASVILLSPLASGFRTIVKPSTVGRQICSVMDSIFCPSIQYIKNIRVPVAIVHGRDDNVIPIHNAEELYAAVDCMDRFEPLYLEKAGHNDITSKHQQKLLMYIETFLAYCDKQKQAREEYT